MNEAKNQWGLGQVKEPVLKVESTRVSLDDLNDKIRNAKA